MGPRPDLPELLYKEHLRLLLDDCTRLHGAAERFVNADVPEQVLPAVPAAVATVASTLSVPSR